MSHLPQGPPAARPLSRRGLLSRLTSLGFVGLGAAMTGCHAPSLPSLMQEVVGQARQATGATPPAKILHWVTPIPPLDPDRSRQAVETYAQSQAIGWAQMLAPWRAAHPEITVEHEVVAAEALTKRQLALAESDSPIDVAYTDWAYVLGEAGVLDPLDLGTLSRRIVPVALDAQSSGDQTYAFPVFLSGLGLYANHQRFQSAGLDPAQPPRDWSSFETSARKLTDRASEQYGFDVFGSGSPLSGQARYGPFLWSAGGSFFDNAGSRAIWNEPSGLDALIFLARLSQNYATPGSAAAADKNLIENWLSGQTAMLLAGPEISIAAEQRGLTYSVQAVPAYIQGQSSSLVLSAGAIGIFARSRHKDWALDFARYVAGKDAQVDGLATLPLLPANTEAGDAAPVFQRNATLGQFLRILREDDIHAFPRPRARRDEVQEIFRAYLGIALEGLATPEAAWNRSASEATALLREGLTPTPS